MKFTTQELISLLKSSISPLYEVEKSRYDPVFEEMGDEDFLIYLKLAVERVYPSVSSFEDLPDGSSYPIILLAKKELYLKLAVTHAEDYDVSVESGNSLKREQRFKHYLSLAKEAEDEFSEWENNADKIDPDTGVSGVNTYNTIRSKNHYSTRNYELELLPKVSINIDSVTNDSIKFSWKSFNNDHFAKYLVYLKEGDSVVDVYADGTNAESKVTKDSVLIKSTSNFRDTFKCISNLKPDTLYYLAVFSIERNQLFGFKEISFQTEV